MGLFFPYAAIYFQKPFLSSTASGIMGSAAQLWFSLIFFCFLSLTNMKEKASSETRVLDSFQLMPGVSVHLGEFSDGETLERGKGKVRGRFPLRLYLSFSLRLSPLPLAI